MCKLFSRTSFLDFTGAEQSRDLSCDKKECCCGFNQWGVNEVRLTGGGAVDKTRFEVVHRSYPSSATENYGALICHTNIKGSYTITLQCGNTLTAKVS